MAKYSFAFKKKVVTAYLNGKGGQLAQKFNIPNKCEAKKWIDNYTAFGDDGLKRSRKNEYYSFEKKLFVVELYLSSEISICELAIREGITNPSMISIWVNRFRAAGPDALRPCKKGRKKILNKPKVESKVQKLEESYLDTSAEHVKELEDELLKLRIENAFLKEIGRAHV